MPVYDVDGGLVWRGYDPRLFSKPLPKEQYISKPFYFGGSQVPVFYSKSMQGTGMMASTQMPTAIPELKIESKSKIKLPGPKPKVR